MRLKNLQNLLFFYGVQISEASIKVSLSGELFHRVAEGDGPVNALDEAFRQSLRNKYSFIKDVKLHNFNVKVIDSKIGSAAYVRVWSNFSDGKLSWQTVGVSENIIEASFNAIVDGFDYKIMKENS